MAVVPGFMVGGGELPLAFPLPDSFPELLPHHLQHPVAKHFCETRTGDRMVTCVCVGRVGSGDRSLVWGVGQDGGGLGWMGWNIQCGGLGILVA